MHRQGIRRPLPIDRLDLEQEAIRRALRAAQSGRSARIVEMFIQPLLRPRTLGGIEIFHADAEVGKVGAETVHTDLGKRLALEIERSGFPAGVATVRIVFGTGPIRTIEIIAGIIRADCLRVAEIASVRRVNERAAGDAARTLGMIYA